MDKEKFDYKEALNYLYRGGEFNELLEMFHPIDGWIPVILDGMVRMRVNAPYRLKGKNECSGRYYTHEEIMTKWFRKKTNTFWSKFTAFDEKNDKRIYEYNNTYYISHEDICREFVMSDLPR